MFLPRPVSTVFGVCEHIILYNFVFVNSFLRFFGNFYQIWMFRLFLLFLHKIVTVNNVFEKITEFKTDEFNRALPLKKALCPEPGVLQIGVYRTV
jgi:hypothetical protein